MALADAEGTNRGRPIRLAQSDQSFPGRVSSRQPKLGEQIAQQIVDEICDKGLAAGDRLPPEPAFLERYGVGRATFREGLRILEMHGVVDVRRGAGGGPKVVGHSSPADLASALRLHLQLRGAVYEDVVAARLAIEPFLARLAAQNQEPAGIRMLDQVIRDLDAVDFSDREALSALAGQFRLALGAASGNPLVDLLATALLEVYLSRMHKSPMLDSSSIQSDVVPLYRRVAAAIVVGDAHRAERYMKRLIEFHSSAMYQEDVFASERVRWH